MLFCGTTTTCTYGMGDTFTRCFSSCWYNLNGNKEGHDKFTRVDQVTRIDLYHLQSDTVANQHPSTSCIYYYIRKDVPKTDFESHTTTALGFVKQR